jgi:uncharacterized protein Yka (UPF0111/DUF47 family)
MNSREYKNRWLLVAMVALLGISGCQSMRYRALETVGIEKRGILEARVEAASEAQDEAGEQFETTLDRFRSVVELEEGDLERAFRKFRREYRRSVDRAEAVRERIQAVERVAGDLFEEWEGELDGYSDPDLRARSEELLQQTRQRYGVMIRTMNRAEARIDPVLRAFEDQVLFLKHNLNSMAVAAIRGEVEEVEAETGNLLAAMRDSIAEANRFIENLE